MAVPVASLFATLIAPLRAALSRATASTAPSVFLQAKTRALRPFQSLTEFRCLAGNACRHCLLVLIPLSFIIE